MPNQELNILKKSINRRLVSEISIRNPLHYLKDQEIDYEIVLSVIHLRASTGTSTFVEVAKTIGDSLRRKWKLKLNTPMSVKTGAFILYSLEEIAWVKLESYKTINKGKINTVYKLKVLEAKLIAELWANSKSSFVSKMPSSKPYEPWITTRHPEGIDMVKSRGSGVNKIFSPETHPIVFETLNKAMAVGWNINTKIYELQRWAYRNKEIAFNDIWSQIRREAKATKNRETKIIFKIAEEFLHKTFYHLYYYDFRGRKYPSTAYLHEQGGDVARGLLLRKDCKEIGKEGFFWLMVSIASNWAGYSGRKDKRKTDKIPLKDRFKWAIDNEETLLAYGMDPKKYKDWMHADKPWQFLAACIELVKLREYQIARNNFDDYDYKSHLEVFIDGSNNGSQHLVALTRDEITAPYVNLVQSDFPGDLYSYVAEHVWKNIEKRLSKVDKESIEEKEIVLQRMLDMSQNIAKTEGDDKKILIEIYKAYVHKYNDDIVSLLFWNSITDLKERRKIVKRGTMTLPYGATQYGLGEQVLDDAKKHGITKLTYMNFKWGIYMGNLLYKTCIEHLERPMRLLSIFEEAGKEAEKRKEYLTWRVPITNFIVKQYYVTGQVKRLWVHYGMGNKKANGHYDSELNLSVAHNEYPLFKKGKQRSGVAPNAIHSLDAAHLMLIVNRADFPVTTVHDSFGCLFADMTHLFKITRETFVELYKDNPLYAIMDDIGGDVESIEIGDLDINEVIKSEYCFS